MPKEREYSFDELYVPSDEWDAYMQKNGELTVEKLRDSRSPSVFMDMVVNESNVNWNVRSGEQPNSPIIGQILAGNAFIHWGSHPGGNFASVVFRQANPIRLRSGNLFTDSWGTDITHYSHSFEFLTFSAQHRPGWPNNSFTTTARYHVLNVRRNAAIVRPNGENWGTAGANSAVACLRSTVGSTIQETPIIARKQVDLVRRLTDNRWILIDHAAASFGGFVDIGFTHGATRATKSIFGRQVSGHSY